VIPAAVCVPVVILEVHRVSGKCETPPHMIQLGKGCISSGNIVEKNYAYKDIFHHKTLNFGWNLKVNLYNFVDNKQRGKIIYK
jgi:hypothetical protein